MHAVAKQKRPRCVASVAPRLLREATQIGMTKRWLCVRDERAQTVFEESRRVVTGAPLRESEFNLPLVDPFGMRVSLLVNLAHDLLGLGGSPFSHRRRP